MNPELIKHFKLSESELKQIQAALHPGQTLLEVLLERNVIDRTAYIQWAKDAYSLPILKVEFLNKTNNIDALLDRYKSVFPRNVIPFHEMDGVLYVMCLEPTPFEAPQPIQYVLAPFDVISKYAAKTVPKQMPHQEVEVQLVKENTNPLFKNLDTQKTDTPEGFSFDKITLDGENAAPAAPEGVNFTPPPEGVELKAAEGEMPDIKLEEKKDVPAGLNFPSEKSGEAQLDYVTDGPVTAVDLKSFKNGPASPTSEQEVEPGTASTSHVDMNSLKFEGIGIAAEEYKAPVEEGPKLTTASVDTLIAKNPPKKAATATPPSASAATPPPPPQPTQTASPIPPITPIATAKTPVGAQQFDGILNAMKKYFDQSMVLMFKNGHLEPEAWDSSWVKAAHTQSMIDVTTPSIFRIVNETQNPYHGYIVPNPINESFFNNWNKGQYPQHITICPILHEKKVYGMILGTTTKEGAKKYQLHHIQEIANDAFALIRSKAAA